MYSSPKMWTATKRDLRILADWWYIHTRVLHMFHKQIWRRMQRYEGGTSCVWRGARSGSGSEGSRGHTLREGSKNAFRTRQCINILLLSYRSKLDRDRDRDVTEKIALGVPTGGASQDSLFDQRLFNQSKVPSLPFSLLLIWLCCWRSSWRSCLAWHSSSLPLLAKI